MRRLIVLTSVLALVTAATALAETRIYSGANGGSFPVEPAKLKYSAAEAGYPQSFVFKQLDWKHWGDDKATSDAKLKSCSNSSGSCFTTNAELTAKKKQKGNTGAYYTKLKVLFGQNGVVIGLPTD
ncbi:MAG: hypothetical protein ACHQJ5_04425 [Vicinamibacteria bacterium]|jgi:hypothetical protein